NVSVRDQDSFTGLPIACEASAASSAASWNRCRPNEPPPCVTWTVTAVAGRPSAAAISPWATIGALRLDQISAPLAVTEAIAQSGSSGVLLLNAKKKVPVT